MWNVYIKYLKYFKFMLDLLQFHNIIVNVLIICGNHSIQYTIL